MQILTTLKLLPIGNKTMLRDSRILSVVEKWSSEITASTDQSTDVAMARTESTDITEDVEQDQDGSGTEAREEINGIELTDVAAVKQDDSASPDHTEIHPPSVSIDRSGALT